jgi:hypothetical protein
MIAVLGATAIWLTQQRRDDWRKFACLLGMAAQPFWFWATFQAEQWGIFAVSFIYTYSWGVGIKNHWLAEHYQ